MWRSYPFRPEYLSALGAAGSGTLGDNSDWPASISADGRYVTFQSDAALIAADTNGKTDVYVYDRRRTLSSAFRSTSPTPARLTALQNDFLSTASSLATKINRPSRRLPMVALSSPGPRRIPARTGTKFMPPITIISATKPAISTSIPTPPATRASLPSRVSADGRVVVVWTTPDRTAPRSTAKFSIRPARSVASCDISTSALSNQSAPTITALADGSFVVTWQSANGATGSDISARIFDSTGASVAAATSSRSTPPRARSDQRQDHSVCRWQLRGGLAIGWPRRQRGGNLRPAFRFQRQRQWARIQDQRHYRRRSEQSVRHRAGQRRVRRHLAVRRPGRKPRRHLRTNLFGQHARRQRIRGQSNHQWRSVGAEHHRARGWRLPRRLAVAERERRLRHRRAEFQQLGVAVSNDITIEVTTAGDQTAPQLATLANGSVVAIWQGPDGQGGTDVFARVSRMSSRRNRRPTAIGRKSVRMAVTSSSAAMRVWSPAI